MTAVLDDVENDVADEVAAPPTDSEVIAALRTGSTVDVVLGLPLVTRIEALQRQIESVNSIILSEREQHAAWLDSLQERASEEAQDHDWCGEFEKYMETAGLEGRRSVTVSAWATLTVSYTLDSDDAERVFDYINGSDCDPGDFDGRSAEITCSLSVSATVETKTGGCVCNDVDWSTATPSWVDDHCTYYVEESNCDNCSN